MTNGCVAARCPCSVALLIVVSECTLSIYTRDVRCDLCRVTQAAATYLLFATSLVASILLGLVSSRGVRDSSTLCRLVAQEQ